MAAVGNAATTDTELLAGLPVLGDDLYWRVTKYNGGYGSIEFTLQIIRPRHGALVSRVLNDPVTVARQKELVGLIDAADVAYEKAQRRYRNAYFFRKSASVKFFAAEEHHSKLLKEKRNLVLPYKYINAEILLDAAHGMIPALESVLAEEEVERRERLLEKESDKFVGNYPAPLEICD